MYNNSTSLMSGVGGGGGSSVGGGIQSNPFLTTNTTPTTNINENPTEPQTITNQLGLDPQQQLDMSNLLINSWETDEAALEQYESEMDRTLNDNLLIEKEQSTQRLFQSFQTSACAVAQMFKDKTASSAQLATSNTNTSSSALSSWQSFQNSAGAITVLYKDSLEACKVHMDLGICVGQQRKLKEIINWIKKKKKRTIRKDELISFLIGKQYTSSSNQNQMFNLFSQNSTNSGLSNTTNGTNHLISSTNNLTLSSSQPLQQQQQASSVFSAPFRRQQAALTTNTANRQQQQQQQQPVQRSNSSTSNLALSTIGENSSGSNDSQAVETNSDLATFREALIMHNRSRDLPLNRHNHLSHSNHHLNHLNHYHPTTTQATNPSNSSISPNNASQQQQQQQQQVNCDDLDCFFCEQIATHIEQKRSAANINIDMESPTRKRGRFY